MCSSAQAGVSLERGAAPTARFETESGTRRRRPTRLASGSIQPQTGPGALRRRAGDGRGRLLCGFGGGFGKTSEEAAPPFQVWGDGSRRGEPVMGGRRRA